MKTAKKGWGHIVLLALIAIYFFIITGVYLSVGQNTGMIKMILQEGRVEVMMAPIIGVLFSIGAVYELVHYIKGGGNKAIRIICGIFLAFMVVFYLVWGVTNGRSSDHTPVDFADSSSEVVLPTLKEICPKEYLMVQSELGQLHSQASSHTSQNKSDIAQYSSVSQSLHGQNADPETGIYPMLFYYTATHYKNIVSPKYVELFSEEWLRMNGGENKIASGEIDSYHYMYAQGDVQHLLLWDERTILIVDYSGMTSLVERIQLFVDALTCS